MQLRHDGRGFRARLALISAVLLLGGSATASVLNLGNGSSRLSNAPGYPKVSAAVLATRRSSGSTYGGTRYGTSRRSYGGGGYSGGK